MTCTTRVSPHEEYFLGGVVSRGRMGKAAAPEDFSERVDPK